MSASAVADSTALALKPSDDFAPRHIAPRDSEIAAMLGTLGLPSLDALATRALPASIFDPRPLQLPAALTESEAIAKLRGIADHNAPHRSFIGMGYSNCIVPPLIARNILENPGWYTQYTP